MNGQAFKYIDIRDILKKQNASVLITQELKSIWSEFICRIVVLEYVERSI